MNATSFELTDIRRLLMDLIARELRLDPFAIDGSQTFTQYGLDSIAALTIAGDLEELLSVELESTLLWDCPTVDSLAAHLRGMLAPSELASSDLASSELVAA